ncbi:hypothetical protein GXN76_03075 [Kroppenstedtia pulmonis]|uniref:Uncharacterized protein n=1 Tax=Kroppenstedtia pulmonis TaxID=1380685 RepID=A0A7D4BV01_9BACL|nr:hypothetical protein [Kroppenstedtia pulmonis]QKG83553.1 hypothetical protein GXN76_03075 [Kroppenstedtia pulmonis]
MTRVVGSAHSQGQGRMIQEQRIGGITRFQDLDCIGDHETISMFAGIALIIFEITNVDP